jgi:hypothetical protein
VVVDRSKVWRSYDGNAVVVNVCLLVKLLLNLGVLDLGPGRFMLALESKLYHW